MSRRLRLLELTGSLLIGCAALLGSVALFGSPQRAQASATLCVQSGNASCFSSISAALAAAHDGDTIQVASGAYTEYVVITRTVTVQGGWNSDFTARDPNAYPTIIRPPDDTFSVVHLQGQFGVPTATTPPFDGFVVTGGGGGNHAGGILVTNSKSVVSHQG